MEDPKDFIRHLIEAANRPEPLAQEEVRDRFGCYRPLLCLRSGELSAFSDTQKAARSVAVWRKCFDESDASD